LHLWLVVASVSLFLSGIAAFRSSTGDGKAISPQS
jgi:hypothetical protein